MYPILSSFCAEWMGSSTRMRAPPQVSSWKQHHSRRQKNSRTFADNYPQLAHNQSIAPKRVKQGRQCELPASVCSMQWCERVLHAMVRACAPCNGASVCSMQWCERPASHSLAHFFTHSLQPNDSKYFDFNQPGINDIGRMPSLIPKKKRNLPKKYRGELGGYRPAPYRRDTAGSTTIQNAGAG